MTRVILTIAVEVLALGMIYALLRLANRKLDEQLAGAVSAPGTTRKARTGAAAQESPLDGTKTPARAPSAFPQPLRWPVALYAPCAGGWAVHQFEIEGEVAAAYVALYRVPRFGAEARA